MQLTRSQSFIKRYKKSLDSGRDFMNPDTSYQPVDEFSRAKVKVMIIFPSPSDVKSVSSTKEAINDYVISNCPDVFVDFAYLPSKDDIKLYDKYNMPYAIGHITHLDPSHFNFVGYSISVLSETMTMANVQKSLSRCDTPVPLTWSERKDSPFQDTPVIFLGGITAAYAEILYGDLGDGRIAFPDFTYLGACDEMGILFERYYHQHCIDMEHTSILHTEDYVRITKQDYIESLFDLDFIYHPQAYEVKYNKGVIVSNKKINPKAKDYLVPLYPKELPKDLGLGRTIINANGDAAGVSQIQISEGCSSGGACNFCAEGWYTGAWREQPIEEIVKQAWESKKYSAGYKIKPFSFNCNYVTDFTNMLYELMQIYPTVNFINMRLEELGKEPDQLKIMKLIGANRISAPVEGISDKVRNGLLNKNLSLESLDKFMDFLISLKMTDIKVGGIATQYEEAEDWEEILKFLKDLKDKAALWGLKIPIRFNFTPLVHYPMTPMEYMERRTARNSFHGGRNIPKEYSERFKELGVRTKVNGFRNSTFLEQSIVDLGRYATPWLYTHIVLQENIIYSLRSAAKEELVEALKSLVDEETFFKERNPDAYISSCHRIRIPLQGGYINQARELLKYGKEKPVTTRCIATYTGCKTKCYANAVPEGFKVFSDVEIVNGQAVGDYTLMTGCSWCETKEEKVARLKRRTDYTHTSEDITAVPRRPKQLKMRFVVERLPEYDILNPNNTSHTFVTKYLQQSERLLKTYHSVESHSMYWSADPEIPYYTSGIQLVDVVFTDKSVKQEIIDMVESVNQSLKSIRIQSVFEVFMEDKIKVSDYNIFRFETTYPLELFEASKVSYKGEVRVVKDLKLQTVLDKSLRPPAFVSTSKVIGYFALPLKYNPLLFMQGFLKDKKIPLAKIRESFKFQNMLVLRDSQVVCKCGEETGAISMVTAKQLSYGRNCVAKALLSNELAKIRNKK